ncbi:NUDIX domain-containing protein, partial [Rickettsiales bacterium]|nr:NUDIX domain-containing protein [Rickettsiales bacterium]
MSYDIPKDMKVESISRTIAARGMLFNKDNELLIVSENGSTWFLPGGWADEGEILQIACEREIEEEVGIVAKSEKVIFMEEAIVPDKFDDHALL